MNLDGMLYRMELCYCLNWYYLNEKYVQRYMNDEMYNIYILCEGNVCDVVGSLIMWVNFHSFVRKWN